MEQTTSPARHVPITYTGNITFAIDVTDLDRSIAWYQDVLGFELDYRLESIGWCELRTASQGITIGLGEAEEPKTGNATPTFSVTNIDESRRHLESHGVRFDGETREVADMVKLATFYDPDGNSFMLAETFDPQTAEGAA